MDDSGRTALIAAVLAGEYFDNTEMVKLLLVSGANPRHEENSYHMTAFHFAAAKGKLALVEILAKEGFDIN